MKLAFLYAGQGSQQVGMGKDLYQKYPLFRTVFDQAELPFSLAQLCFEGPLETLSQTQYTQPCLVAVEVGITKLLEQEGIVPDYAMGLSLGEYSALYAAGVFSQQEVLETVAFRARAMEQAAQGIDSSMQAVMGLSKEQIQRAVEQARSLGVVEICNDNCPGQIVIGGERAAVERAAEYAKQLGAKRCMPLNVSGPFHTSLMAPAADALREYWKAKTFCSPKIPVVFNATASLQGEESISSLLERQVQTQVRFADSLRFLAQQGVDTLLEIGPGKTLTGFARKTVPQMTCLHVEDEESLQQVKKEWKGETV